MVNWLQGTKLGGILRTAGLWLLIIADASLLASLYWTSNYIWLAVFSVITIWIVAAELYGMFVGFDDNADGERKKMTISTAYKRYIQRVGWVGYIPLALFFLAMSGLVLHLAVW